MSFMLFNLRVLFKKPGTMMFTFVRSFGLLFIFAGFELLLNMVVSLAAFSCHLGQKYLKLTFV
jgi:hypothetical protein